MRTAVALRWVLRESRGARGRMSYFVACIAVGVAAVVGASGLSASVAQAFRDRSREFLGADFTVDAARPLPAELDGALVSLPGTERTELTETAAMAAAPGPDGKAVHSLLVQLHVIAGRYPLYGELTTDPPGGLAVHLRETTAVVAPELLSALSLRPGDGILIGGVSFRVAAAIVRAPPRFGVASFLGPLVYVDAAGLKRTHLLGFGIRVRHRALFALPAGATRRDLDDVTARVRSLADAQNLDVAVHYQVGPGGGPMTMRLEAFLGLVALLSLVVGGIGVAQIVRTWIAGRTQAIAVMRCLGLTPVEILALSLGHVGLLAVAGSVVGAAFGFSVPAIVGWVAPDLVPGGLPLVFPVGAALRGLVLGLGIALVFSVPPLAAVWRVPPARVLRSDAAPLPAPRGVSVVSALLVLGGIFTAAWVQAGRGDWALWFTGGFLALVTALHLGGRLLVGLAVRAPRRKLNAYVAHGVAALARPGASTAASVVALGLGTMVVVAMWLVHTRLRDGFLSLAPRDAPTVFLVDVLPEQWAGVEDALRDAGATNVDRMPIVMARIAAIDGRPVAELVDAQRAAQAPGWVQDAVTGGQGGPGRDVRSRLALTREHRLTSRAQLPADNRIVAGALWSDPARAEASVEERTAVDLGVRLGSTIAFDVHGVPIEVVVTSLRSAPWQSLALNVRLVVEPGVLDSVPTLVLVAARVPAETESALRDRVSHDCPNVAVLQLGTVLAEVAALVGRVASGVSALGSFCVAAGMLVLAGAAAATALRRRREVALLKTLGVTRAGVTVLFAVEYGLVGAVAGLVGAGGALLLAWAFLAVVADVEVDLPLVALPVTAVACAVSSAACGLAAGWRALAARPIEVLRRAGE